MYVCMYVCMNSSNKNNTKIKVRKLSNQEDITREKATMSSAYDGTNTCITVDIMHDKNSFTLVQYKVVLLTYRTYGM